MSAITIRVPATTANLGPGFDSFGCALSLYTDVTFEIADDGLCITGCDTAYANADNMVYQAYRAVLAAIQMEDSGVHIHLEASIPISRGLGSSAALLAAGAMGANLLHGGKLSTAELLRITNTIEGHPDNLAPAFYGGLTASMVEEGVPVTAQFALHPGWRFLALVPDFELSTAKARSVLPQQVSRADALYNVSHGAMVLKALETGDEALLQQSMQDRLHQDYRKHLIPDYEAIRALAAEAGSAFCLSGAGPTLLCITRSNALADTLQQKLPLCTSHHWTILPLAADMTGARVVKK